MGHSPVWGGWDAVPLGGRHLSWCVVDLFGRPPIWGGRDAFPPQGGEALYVLGWKCVVECVLCAASGLVASGLVHSSLGVRVRFGVSSLGVSSLGVSSLGG